jgi:hypothetical protein
VRLGHIVKRDAINVNRDIVGQSSIIHQNFIIEISMFHACASSCLVLLLLLNDILPSPTIWILVIGTSCHLTFNGCACPILIHF